MSKKKNSLSRMSKERLTDLGKLNLLLMVRFGLEPIYTTAPAASKIDIRFKND